MQLFFLYKTAWRSLSQHKGRSLLTIISIIVGIASVIATLAIGRGAQEKIRSQIAHMGSNILILHSFRFQQSGASHQNHSQKSRILREDDIEILRTLRPDITALSGVCRVSDRLCSYRNQRIIAPFTLCHRSFFEITKRPIALGRNFLPHEDRTGGRVCILGAHAARDLFKTGSALHKSILVGNTTFTVIGVLEESEDFQMLGNRNMTIFVPLTTGRKVFTDLLPTDVRSIYISCNREASLDQIERTIQRTMRARHNLASGQSDDFTIVNQAGMMKAAEQSSNVFTLFLLIVASLSLLVGGIGVSNIMLVSVTERTKEIGIRLALGAPPYAIMSQFLIESVILCGAGGVLGVICGVTLPFFISFFTGWAVIVTLTSVIYSVLFTLVLGVVFGFWPARRAANMNVVEALHER